MSSHSSDSTTEWLGSASQKQLLQLASNITIKPGQLTVRVDGTEIAEMLTIDPDALNEEALCITSVFQIRKRGVETNLSSRTSRQDKTTS